MFTRLAVLAISLAFCPLLDAQSAPEILYRVRPIYPKLAKAARIQGVVRLRVTVNSAGTVDEIKLLSGHPFLVEAAIDAVRQWRFRPAMDRGVPVAAVTTTSLTFSLNREPANNGPVVYV